MNAAIDSKDPNFLRRFVEDLVKSLNGMEEGDTSKLPADLRDKFNGLFKSISDGAKSLLDKLPTIPAADSSAQSLNQSAAWAGMVECTQQLMATLAKMKTELSTTALSLNSLNAKIEKGELIDAATAKQNADTAAQTAVEKAVKDRTQLLASRRQDLLSANLPLPADDELLAGDDAAFTAFKTRSTKRVTDLGTRSLNSADPELLYAPDAAFDLAVKTATAAAKKGGVADPMAGGGAAGGGAPKKRFIV